MGPLPYQVGADPAGPAEGESALTVNSEMLRSFGRPARSARQSQAVRGGHHAAATSRRPERSSLLAAPRRTS